MQASARSVSFTLVKKSMATQPTIVIAMRSAYSMVPPITASTSVTSLVTRDETSPVRVSSKKPGESVRRCS